MENIEQIDLKLPDIPIEFIINNCGDRPKFDINDCRSDFFKISKYFHCAVYGNDFNSVFIFNAQHGKHSFNISLVSAAEILNQEDIRARALIMLQNICSMYKKSRVYVNVNGICIDNIHLDDIICTIFITNTVFSSVSDLLLSVPFDSQQICYYNGKLYSSTRFAAAMETGQIPVRVENYCDYFEGLMAREFRKGFSITLSNFRREEAISYCADFVYSMIMETPLNSAIKADIGCLIKISRITLWPIILHENVAECDMKSWINVKYPLPPLQHNTRVLRSGAATFFYTLIYIHSSEEWQLNKEYGLEMFDPKILKDIVNNFGDEIIYLFNEIRNNYNTLHVPRVEELLNFRFYASPLQQISYEDWYNLS